MTYPKTEEKMAGMWVTTTSIQTSPQHCWQPIQYGSCQPPLPQPNCFETCHILCLPLCPLHPGASPRTTAAYALRRYLHSSDWRVGSCGMSPIEDAIISNIAACVNDYQAQGIIDSIISRHNLINNTWQTSIGEHA